MSNSPRRGRRYQPPQGQGSHGAPPPYQGSQWQQPQHQQQWQQPQQDWGRSYEPSYDQYGDAHGGYGGSHGSEMELAPIHRRAGARIIDNALVAVFGFALILPVTIAAFGLGGDGTDDDEGGIWNWPIIFTLFFVMSVLPFLYEAVQLSMWGRTLGKRVMGLGIVQARPAGEPMNTTQAVWRAGVVHVGYQVGVFFFLVLAVMVWEYAAYGMALVWVGGLMAYLWAIWDQPLHQALHDRFAGTLVIDERGTYEGYGDQYTEYAE
ncbi:RDD family protein [Spirillospora sp. NPDC048832]